MTTTPYQPHQFSESDVELLQELILSKRIFALSKASSQKIRFLKKISLAKEGLSLSIPLTINGEKIDLALQATPDSSLAHQLLELGSVENIPQEFVTALNAFCSKEIINAFALFLQTPVALWKEGDSATIPAKKYELFFEIFQGDNNVEAQGSITLSPFLLTKLLELAATVPAAQEFHFNTVTLTGEIVVGSASLTPADWSKLTVGALIFLKEPISLVTGEANFFFGSSKKIPMLLELKQVASLVTPLAKFSFDSSAFSQQKQAKEEQLSHSKSLVNIGVLAEAAAGDEGQGASACRPAVYKEILEDASTKATLPFASAVGLWKKSIELNVSAGSLALTLEEISLLVKNKKIEKAPTLLRPLKILAQGNHIGTGELVSIHDQHALFVTQLVTTNVIS